ncbi:SnoaL-like domain-containing protein [Flexivirga sp. ID2601S]|uniref:SnoaL-like domain-containing protein n=1 Tax=Flexivirga aerilata TaxID=1656889 RepID=A0A849AEP6_9MICO|nr:nuclear transport factor 2 family protein [Flexivirga aerilata]NNG38293.1 SnoaL-like domain-containing protein [Flexivirga aerilata]
MPDTTRTPAATSADRATLRAEVDHFYAIQLRRLDARDARGFAATFAQDGFLRHETRDEEVVGVAAIADTIEESFRGTDGWVARHWFDKLLIEPIDDETVHVDYYALVSLTDAGGEVRFLPTCTVKDVLVRAGETYLTARRTIYRDTPG